MTRFRHAAVLEPVPRGRFDENVGLGHDVHVADHPTAHNRTLAVSCRCWVGAAVGGHDTGPLLWLPLSGLRQVPVWVMSTTRRSRTESFSALRV
jgi:hypothetical protein